MGKLMRNGVPYSGSTDSAKHIKFDPTSTALSGTNVQHVVEEISSKLTEQSSTISDLRIEIGLEITQVASLIGVTHNERFYIY